MKIISQALYQYEIPYSTNLLVDFFIASVLYEVSNLLRLCLWTYESSKESFQNERNKKACYKWPISSASDGFGFIIKFESRSSRNNSVNKSRFVTFHAL